MSAYITRILTLKFTLDGNLNGNPITRPAPALFALFDWPLSESGLHRKPSFFFADYACAYRYVFAICGAVSTQHTWIIQKLTFKAYVTRQLISNPLETAETTVAIKEYPKFSAPIHRLWKLQESANPFFSPQETVARPDPSGCGIPAAIDPTLKMLFLSAIQLA